MPVLTYYYNTLKETLPWFRKLLWWALAWLVAGAIIVIVNPEASVKLMNWLQKMLESIVPDRGVLDWQMVWSIFRQNLRAATIVLFAGVLLGIVPLISIAFNSFIIGFFISYLFRHSLIAGFSSLLVIIPHGIFEIPALLIAALFGLRLGWFWKTKKPGQKNSSAFADCFLTNVLLIPLLVVLFFLAATTEVFVSGNIGEALARLR